jgi:intracellular sulfur oxidation DsrE/DsrF family protein
MDDSNIPSHYFFDVYGHSADEITALLERAEDVYENLPAEIRPDIRIAVVLHGPDVAFFATENYARNKPLVDLAASLDAFGFVDLKVCAASVRNQGLEASNFPPFIELVPYGPAEVSRLQAADYVQL